MGFDFNWQVAWNIWAAVACGGAIWRGGVARKAGLGVACAWVLSLVIHDQDWPNGFWMLFGVDLVVTLWLVVLTRSCTAPWLIFSAACGLLMVVNYTAYALFASIDIWAFFSASYIWNSGLVAGLLWGALTRTGYRAPSSARL